jgi:hypothetical protein
MLHFYCKNNLAHHHLLQDQEVLVQTRLNYNLDRKQEMLFIM